LNDAKNIYAKTKKKKEKGDIMKLEPHKAKERESQN